MFTPYISQLPPAIGAFCTEQHHSFFGRLNIGVLATMKCNHDIRVTLAVPGNVDSHLDVDSLCANMATAMTSLVHYVTDYTGKAQPQLTNLWKLLADGQRRLQSEMQELPPEKRVLRIACGVCVVVS